MHRCIKLSFVPMYGAVVTGAVQGTDTEAVILQGKTCTTISSPPPLLLHGPDRKSAMKVVLTKFVNTLTMWWDVMWN